MVNEFVFVFPGQGSQSIGMGQDLYNNYASAKKVFAQMDEVVGYKLSELMFSGNPEDLNDTIHTQPALFSHSFAAYQIFQELFRNSNPVGLAGHSLGELSACVSSGSLSFADGLSLVIKRGKLMKKAGEVNPGSMAAILGLEIPILDKVCLDSSTSISNVQVANDNCPGQVVISGHKEAVELACVNAKTVGAKRALPLAVSIAAHSSLMDSIQKEWDEAVDSTEFGAPNIPIIGNVSAKELTTAEMIKTDLKMQMQSRVRWTETIQGFAAQGLHNYFEIGNGAVLSGLIKRIDPEATIYPFGNNNDLLILNG